MYTHIIQDKGAPRIGAQDSAEPRRGVVIIISIVIISIIIIISSSSSSNMQLW